MPFSLNPILEKRRTVLLSAQLSSFPARLFLHLDVYYPPRRNRDLLNLGNQARTFSNSKVDADCHLYAHFNNYIKMYMKM